MIEREKSNEKVGRYPVLFDFSLCPCTQCFQVLLILVHINSGYLTGLSLRFCLYLITFFGLRYVKSKKTTIVVLNMNK